MRTTSELIAGGPLFQGFDLADFHTSYGKWIPNKPWVFTRPKVRGAAELLSMSDTGLPQGTQGFHPESRVRSTFYYYRAFLEELLWSQSHNNVTNE